MKNDIRNYAKIGIVHSMAYPQAADGKAALLDTLHRVAKDDYFDAIEVNCTDDDSSRVDAKKILDASRMTVVYSAQSRLIGSGLNINDLDEDIRQKAVALMKRSIDEAYEMGAVTIAFLSGRYEKDRIDDSLDALVRSTKEICSYAKSKGDMMVVHEVFDSEIEKKSLVGPSAIAKKYAEAVCKDCSNFGLLVDLSHVPLLSETPSEAILPIKDHLVHAHIGNCVMADPSMPCYGDLHPRFGYPDSENDVPEVTEFLRVLMDVGFLDESQRPILSFEVKPYDGEDSDLVVAGAKRTLNEAWARL